MHPNRPRIYTNYTVQYSQGGKIVSNRFLVGIIFLVDSEYISFIDTHHLDLIPGITNQFYLFTITATCLVGVFFIFVLFGVPA